MGSPGNDTGHEHNIFTLTPELPFFDPGRSSDYFKKFQPAIVKFIRLPIVGSPPNLQAPR